MRDPHAARSTRSARTPILRGTILGSCTLVLAFSNGSPAQALGLGTPHAPVSLPLAREFGSRRNLEITAAGTAATWFAYTHEDAARMQLALERVPGEGGGDAGNVYGNGLLLGAGTAALWSYGRFTHDSYAMDTASDLTKGLVLSGAVTAGLKFTVQRTRPNGGPYSFPSGHTSAAFAVAPILASRYGWKAGVPAYTLAIMTGLGRMEDNKHYASDVIAGATLGLVVGNAVAHHRSSSLMPEHVYMGKRGLGLKFGF